MESRKVRFGENIRVLRGKLGITQEQLAKEVHVTRQTVSAWEKNISVPSILELARLSTIYEISTDELLFGKMGVQEIEWQKELLVEESSEFIRSIKKKGFYSINEEDISEFFPIIPFEFSRIIGIALELWEKSYRIVSLYANGFGIYFDTDQEAEGFSHTLFDIIEGIIHHREGATAVTYTECVQQRVDAVKITIMEEIHERIFGTKLDEMFFWIDENEFVRGFAKTEEGCRVQALKQGCENYNVLHG